MKIVANNISKPDHEILGEYLLLKWNAKKEKPNKKAPAETREVYKTKK